MYLYLWDTAAVGGLGGNRINNHRHYLTEIDRGKVTCEADCALWREVTEKCHGVLL